MSKPATSIILTPADQHELESWVRASTTEQRRVLRARIVLAAASGDSTTDIARALHVRTATVSKWRIRFAQHGMAGLTDQPRAGKPATYALRLGNGPEQTFDFAASIRDFSVDALQKAQTLDLRASDGAVIHLCRSGNAVYLTPAKGRATYACH